MPAGCCLDNANLEAQSVGLSPALCEPTGAFFEYYTACVQCINTEAGDSEDVINNYVNPSFGQYIDYCAGSSPTASAPGSPPTSGFTTSISTTFPSSPEASATSSDAGKTPIGITIVTQVPFTTTIDGAVTVWQFTKTLTSYAPIPETAVVSLMTVENGHPTVWVFTTTYTPLAWNIDSTSTPTNTIHSSTTTASSPATTEEPGKGTQRSQAWIAGPVVGAVAGVSILALAVWLLFRVRRYRKRRQMGHEVHGESAMKSELEVKHPPEELDGEELARHPVELPTDNP